MNTKLTYRLFTVVDLRNWLIENQRNGLTDRVIARARAYAIIRCPDIKDNDVVISAVFDEDKAIGYTAVFPERFVLPDLNETYYWGSTQWLEPEYRGKGISGIMMRNLKDSIHDRYLGLDSSIASIKLDQKQGSEVVYYPRYFFVWNRQKLDIKSKIKKLHLSCLKNKVRNSVEQVEYTNRYVNFVDDETYNFIVAHSSTYLFLRKQAILNWQLTYPFMQPTWGDLHIEPDPCNFGSYIHDQWVKAVRVSVKDKLVGFYILKCVDGCLTVMYMYYDESYRENVFASITANVLQKDVNIVRMFSKTLYDYMYSLGLRSFNSHHDHENVLLTMPKGWLKDASLEVQGGDGDMFC